MRIDIAAQTDIGRRKKNNEDYFGVFREGTPGLTLFDEGALLCVADGLGGHVGGEIASKLAVSIVKDILKQPPPPTEGNEEGQATLALLRDQMIKANTSIFQTNKELVKAARPMGTTLLTALVQPRRAYIANIGDSRCYHLREGEIIDRTEDHSWVDEQVKLGMMSKSEAESDLRRNLVTRCIGTHEQTEVDTYLWHTAPGDMLLLCTDGLVNMVKDSEIAEIFKQSGGPAEIARRLVDLANENGGKDNITVVVARLEPTLGASFRSSLHGMWKRRSIHIIWAAVSAVAAALGLALGYVLGRGGLLP